MSSIDYITTVKPYGSILPVSEYASLTVLITVSSISFLTNLLLLIAISRKSANSFSNYYFILLNVVLVDLIVSAVSLFSLPSYTSHFTAPPYCLLFIYFSFCGYFGLGACAQSYGILICLYSYIPWLIMASLMFRWFVMRFKEPRGSKAFWIFLALIACPTVFQLYATIATSDNPENAIPTGPLLQDMYPDWDFSNYTTYAMAPKSDWRVGWVGLLSTWPIYPIVVGCLILRWDTLRILKKATILSEVTKKLHRSFIRALTLQVLLLPLIVAKSLVYSASQKYGITGIYYGHLGFILMEFIPLANSLSNLYFVSTYRRFVVNIFKHQFYKASSSNTVTVLPHHMSHLSHVTHFK